MAATIDAITAYKIIRLIARCFLIWFIDAFA